jgi:hypothetical protein
MANEQSSRVNRSLAVGTLTIGGTVQTVLTDAVVTVQKTVPIGANSRFDVALDLTTVQAMAIEVDNDCDVYTNDVSSGSPDDHLVLKAKQPLIWATGDPATLKFLAGDDSTHKVTAFYITTALPTLFKFGAAIDSTPVLTP